MQTNHFSCTACGRCCQTPPEMTLREALGLGDVFVPALLFKVSHIPQDDNEAGFQRLSVERDFSDLSPRQYAAAARKSVTLEAGIPIAGPHGYQTFLTVTAHAWTYPTPMCPALSENRCTIHARRPFTCKTVPIRYDVPDILVGRAFRALMKRTKEGADPYLCDTSDTAPVLLEDDRVVDPAYLEDRARGAEATLSEKPFVKALLESPFLPPMSVLVEELARVNMMSAPFSPVVRLAGQAGFVSKEELRRFCEQQVLLLDREINEALRRGKKDDRPTTTRFRTARDDYKTLLAS